MEQSIITQLEQLAASLKADAEKAARLVKERPADRGYFGGLEAGRTQAYVAIEVLLQKRTVDGQRADISLDVVEDAEWSPVEQELDEDKVLENLRDAIQDAEQFGLVRTQTGEVITGAVSTEHGIVLVGEESMVKAMPPVKTEHDDNRAKWISVPAEFVPNVVELVAFLRSPRYVTYNERKNKR
ncbi:hypothetical protein ACN08P_11290 [Photobacterium leiognathi subsp. mandapamensis]|uniref:hypothetical protein n=1 Tax=Photobacterium leiognathi TaxID=553611 RepID=UPI003AF3AABF